MTEPMSPEELCTRLNSIAFGGGLLDTTAKKKLAGEAIEQYTTAIRQSERAKAEGLVEALRDMIKTFENVPEMAQACFDEPPEPKTFWDYQAFQVLFHANEALTKFNNEASYDG